DRACSEIAGQIVEAPFHLGQTTRGAGFRTSGRASEGPSETGVIDEVEHLLDDEFLQRLGLDRATAAAFVPGLLLAHVAPRTLGAARGTHGRAAPPTAQHPRQQLDRGTAATVAARITECSPDALMCLDVDDGRPGSGTDDVAPMGAQAGDARARQDAPEARGAPLAPRRGAQAAGVPVG